MGTDDKKRKTKKKSTATVTIEDDDEEEVTEKPSKKKKPGKGALTPRPGLKVYQVDPTFMSKESIPFVSVNNYSKMAIRAVLLKDGNLLKRLLDDVKNVASVHVQRCVDIPYDTITYAAINNDDKLLKVLIDDTKKPKLNRAKPTQSLLAKQTTGVYNFHMLGHAVRPIEMSRGGREGNNAFTKDINEMNGCKYLMFQNIKHIYSCIFFMLNC